MRFAFSDVEDQPDATANPEDYFDTWYWCGLSLNVGGESVFKNRQGALLGMLAELDRVLDELNEHSAAEWIIGESGDGMYLLRENETVMLTLYSGPSKTFRSSVKEFTAAVDELRTRAFHYLRATHGDSLPRVVSQWFELHGT